MFIVATVSIALVCFLGSCEQETYMQGKRLYEAHCQNCHAEDGVGLSKLIPPLAKSDYLRDHQSKITCIIRNGQNEKIVVNGIEYQQEMPGKKFTEVQVTNIINYINHAWGNDFGVTTLQKVTNEIRNCK